MKFIPKLKNHTIVASVHKESLNNSFEDNFRGNFKENLKEGLGEY